MIGTLLLFVAMIGLAAVAVAEFMPWSSLGRQLRAAAIKHPKSIAELERRRSLTVEEVALVEKFVPRLQTVVILCHRVDRPTAALAKAVLDNFQQGAAYSFFVSPDYSVDGELSLYHTWFEHIFHTAQGAAPTSGENSAIREKSFSDVFAIRRLPMAWNNVPYIFYTFARESGEHATIAFKGTEINVGISAHYHRVSPTEARAIIDLCSSASEQFVPALGNADTGLNEPIPDTVVDFAEAMARRKKPGGK